MNPFAKLPEYIRDWWRGYTDRDVQSLREKWTLGLTSTPGSIIPLSRGEHAALCSGVELNVLFRDQQQVFLQSAVQDPTRWENR